MDTDHNNIFNLLKDIESLSIEDVKSSRGSIDKNYTDMGSMNEDQFFGRSPSIDYFRSSSLGENGSSPLALNQFDDDYFNEGKKKLTSKNFFLPNDFIVLSTIGNGAYSKVIKVKNKKTAEIYAVKILDKSFMKKENKFYQIYVENEVLNMCNHPNIIKIYGAYESEDQIYLVLEYCPKGDLSDFIEKYAQILQSIEYLNSNNIIHRDIKPGNLVFDKEFILKLVDFSTATLKGKIFDEDELIFIDEKILHKQIEEIKKKEDEIKEKNKLYKENNLKFKHENSSSQSDDSDSDDRYNSEYYRIIRQIKNQHFVGTAEYMAPEVINCREIGVYTDLWSFGCIVYESFMGFSPFKDKTQYLIFQNILQLKYEIDPNIIPEDAQDLIKNLLQLDPKDRLGSGLTRDNSFEKLKQHKFFNNFDTKNYLEILELYLNKTNKKDTNIVTINGRRISSYSQKIDVEKREDKILKVGELKKKSPWFHYDKRKIILYNTPRLDYLDPQSNILKGSIPLNKQTNAELINKTCFILNTPNRKYTFMCKSQFDITPWVLSINDAIKNYSK